VKLTAKEIYQHDDNEDRTKIFPIALVNKYSHAMMAQLNSKHFLYWKVASRLDIGPYKKRGKVEKKEKKSRLLKAAFGKNPTRKSRSSGETIYPDVMISG
jgi:hypothetical protein